MSREQFSGVGLPNQLLRSSLFQTSLLPEIRPLPLLFTVSVRTPRYSQTFVVPTEKV